MALCGHGCRSFCFVVVIKTEREIVEFFNGNSNLEFLEVRATSLICLVGVGIGFGSYLLYRLWNRFMNAPLPPGQKGLPNATAKDIGVAEGNETGLSLPATPDSGVATMGNSQANSTTVTPDAPVVTFGSDEGQVKARYRGKQGNRNLDDSKETVATFNEEDHGFLLVETQDIDLGSQITEKLNNQKKPIRENDTETPSLSKQESDSMKSSQISCNENPNLAKIGEMDRNMMLSTSTDLGFVSGHYSGHESSMERSLNYAASNADLPSSQFEHGMNSNLNQTEGEIIHKCSPIHEDSNGNLSRYRNLSDSSLLHKTGSDIISNPASPRDVSFKLNVTDNTSFDMTQTIHSTPTECGDDLSPFDSAPRTKRLRPPSAPPTGSTKKTHRCYSSDMSSTSADGSYCLWTGNSVDLGENFSGRTTPDSDALKDDGLSSAVSNYDQISEEVQALRLEMDEMNEKLHFLSSRDNMSYLPPPVVDQDLLNSSRGFTPQKFSHRVFRKHNMSSSSFDGDQSVLSLNLSEDNQSVANLSETRRKDLNWDYASDLGVFTSPDPRSFVQTRPVVQQHVHDIETHHEDRMQQYLAQQSESINNTSLSKPLGVHESEFIDDSYFSQHFSRPSPIKEENEKSPLSNKSGSSPRSVKTASPQSVKAAIFAMGDSKEIGDALDSSAGSSQLCKDCQSNCCTNCGKKINANNNISENETATDSASDKSDKSTEKVANSTQTDCYASTQTDLTDLPSLNLRLSPQPSQMLVQNNEPLQHSCACNSELEMSGNLNSTACMLMGINSLAGKQIAIDMGPLSHSCYGSHNQLEVSPKPAIKRSFSSPARNSPPAAQPCSIHALNLEVPSIHVTESLCGCATCVNKDGYPTSCVNKVPSIPCAHGNVSYACERAGNLCLPTQNTQNQSCYISHVPANNCGSHSLQQVSECQHGSLVPSVNVPNVATKQSLPPSHCCHVQSDRAPHEGCRAQQTHPEARGESANMDDNSLKTNFSSHGQNSTRVHDASRHVSYSAPMQSITPVNNATVSRLTSQNTGPSADRIQFYPSDAYASDLYASNICDLKEALDFRTPTNQPTKTTHRLVPAGPPKPNYEPAMSLETPIKDKKIEACVNNDSISTENLIQLDMPVLEFIKEDQNKLLVNLTPEPIEKQFEFQEQKVELNLNVTSSASKKKWKVVNVGERKQISDYVDVEWKGTTEKAKLIRKGYADIESLHGLRYLRQVRGDNYCALRATVFQLLVNGLDLRSHLGTLDHVLKEISVFESSTHEYLQKWTFANRFSYDDVFSSVKECISQFYEQLSKSQELTCVKDREMFFVSTLNANPELDLHLCEAVKCLMMVKAIQYYQQYQSGLDVPTFVWLLYARDTSETPEKLLLNHINKIGDSGGMEMVEMFLLSHTLGIQVIVARPSQQGKVDFVTTFPDEGGEHFPKIYLVAEDDRHYNVLLPDQLIDR